MHTREQVRAQRAWERIRKRQEDSSQGEYKRFAKAFPALLQASGLCQALAFCQSKGPDGYLADLAAVMGAREQDLLKTGRESNISDYMRLTREAMGCADWLQRYADALLRGEDGGK